MKLLIISTPLVDKQFAFEQKVSLRDDYEVTVVNDLTEELANYSGYIFNLTVGEISKELSSICDLKDKFPRSFLIINIYGVDEIGVKKVLFASKANLILNHQKANETYAFTQDGSDFKCSDFEQKSLINKVLKSKYYQTTIKPEYIELTADEKFVLSNYPRYEQDGRIYGTFAVRRDKGFITSTRGKSGGVEAFSFVQGVNHRTKVVTANYKATLNAPLLDSIFKLNPKINYIIHGHDLEGKVVHGEYEFAGTNGDNKFATKMKVGEKVLLTHHGFVVGFNTKEQLEDYLNAK